MSLYEYFLVWFLFGFITYAIKYVKYMDDWRRDGNQVFFVAVLITALIFGPIGLLLTLIRSKGNPFKKI
jgi:O-antigen/teichoic acid export membrane protein